MEIVEKIKKIPLIKPIGGGILIGATAAVATPVIVAFAGFTSTGIAAGSLAASMMSVLGGGATAAGGIVATCQSIGAVGAISSTATAAWTGAGTVGTYMLTRRGAAPTNEPENVRPNALKDAPTNTIKKAPEKSLKNPPTKAANKPIMKDASTSTDDLGVEESGINSGRAITPSARGSTNRSSVSESAPGPSRSNTVSAGTSTDDLSTLEPELGPMQSNAESVAMSSDQIVTLETRRSSRDAAASITSDRGRGEANWRVYRSLARDIATDTDETDDDEQEADTADNDYSSPWIA